MMDIYKAALEAENEILREKVKKLTNTLSAALVWVEDNIGSLTSKALKEHLEGL